MRLLGFTTLHDTRRYAISYLISYLSYLLVDNSGIPSPSPLLRGFCCVGFGMDESATEEEAFYLEQVTLEDDEDDEFDYTEVVVEDDEDQGFGEDAAEDEDLEQALKTLKTREDGLPLVQVEAVPRSAITRRPEVLDDFIRNVLLKMGMVSAARGMRAATTKSHLYACVRVCSAERDTRYVPTRVVPAAGRGQALGGGHGHGPRHLPSQPAAW